MVDLRSNTVKHFRFRLPPPTRPKRIATGTRSSATAARRVRAAGARIRACFEIPDMSTLLRFRGPSGSMHSPQIHEKSAQRIFSEVAIQTSRGFSKHPLSSTFALFTPQECGQSSQSIGFHGEIGTVLYRVQFHSWKPCLCTCPILLRPYLLYFGLRLRNLPITGFLSSCLELS